MPDAKRPKTQLKVIPEPKEGTATVLNFTDTTSRMTGEGNVDLICGLCGYVLFEGFGGKSFDQGSFAYGLVLRCPVCRSFNEVP